MEQAGAAVAAWRASGREAVACPPVEFWTTVDEGLYPGDIAALNA